MGNGNLSELIWDSKQRVYRSLYLKAMINKGYPLQRRHSMTISENNTFGGCQPASNMVQEWWLCMAETHIYPLSKSGLAPLCEELQNTPKVL